MHRGNWSRGPLSGDKTQSDFEKYKQANTKPCPECKVPIEKDAGCAHMKCKYQRCGHVFADVDLMRACIQNTHENTRTRTHAGTNCKHEFCWLCMKSVLGPDGKYVIGHWALFEDSPCYGKQHLPDEPIAQQ